MSNKILVIDDDFLVLKSLHKYLKRLNYEVVTVNSGEEAIKKVNASLFSLIIVDIRMPGMNGIDTIKRIRNISQEKYKTKIPEIIITGYALGEAEKEVRKLDISSYIYKPFDITMFSEEIQKKLT